MKISYAIPVCNEHNELQRLLESLIDYRNTDDEIVILCDEGSTTKEVYDVINSFDIDNFYINENPLNNDFAQQKNYLTSKCSGDWIFLIDADEIPNQWLIQALPKILEVNPDIEAYWVPRINTVKGLTESHIQKWRWNVDQKGWVNFPDWQMRIYRNKEEIKWTRPVHEQLVGHNKFSQFPPEEHYCLYHPKDIKRQEKQNNLYEKIGK